MGQLRRKEYEFKFADKIVDEEFKARQERREIDNSSNDMQEKYEQNNGTENDKINKNETDLEMNDSSEPKKIKIDYELGVRGIEANEKYLDMARKKIDWENKLYLAPLTTVG